MPASASNIAISFEVGDIANTVRGIDDMANSLARLGNASGAALAPAHNPFEGLLSGLSALPGVAGKAALALKGLMVGLDALNTHLNTQAQIRTDFAFSRNYLASDPKTTAILQALGGASGINMEQLANSLRQGAYSTPGKAEAASRLGYPYVPEPLPMDVGKALLDHIDKLRDLYKQDPAEAIRLARNEDPTLLKFLAISDAAMAQVRDFEGARATRFTPEAEAAAVERALNQAMRNQANKEGFGASIIPGMGGARGGQQRLEQHGQNLQKNTQAVQENTEAISKLNGTYGGGSRMRNAIPRGYQGRGDQLDEYLKAEKAKFGSYAVGQ